MATSEQLASWIVKNQDKKGTPEFDTVAASYKAKRAESTQQPAQPIQPTEQPSTGSQLARQAGLTGRILLEGAGDVAGIVGNPLSALTGGAVRRPSEIASDLATRLGLPSAQNPTERFVQSTGRGLVGAGTMAGTSGLLSRAPGMIGQGAEMLAAQPVAQMVSGAGAGGASQLAQEAGVGTGGQIAAGLLGGIAPTAIARGAPLLGGKLADIVGGIGTHTGGEGLKQAAQAGLEGGAKAKAFTENLRGNVPYSDVLDAAKQNLQEMGAQKAAQYRSGMAQVSKDKSVLDFGGIDQAVKDAEGITKFGSQVKNAKAADVQQQIADEISNWKSLDPTKYHTPEGLDALKQKIGGIVESIPYEEKTARMVGNKVYNSIKDEISKQAPVYSETMKGYSSAADQIKEIEKTLSLGDKSSADTAMRKLQSLMRNNANTNYGERLQLAQQLEHQGGQQIMPALAGQSLSSITPRGLGGAAAGIIGAGGLYAHNPLAIPLLATQSPRLMGEAAYALGQGARLARPLAPAAFSDTPNALSRAALYGTMGSQ